MKSVIATKHVRISIEIEFANVMLNYVEFVAAVRRESARLDLR